MTNNPVGSRIFTKNNNWTDQGDIISYACKFAYAGLSKTKYIKYEVGGFAMVLHQQLPQLLHQH
jgi:hypothetical protein